MHEIGRGKNEVPPRNPGPSGEASQSQEKSIAFKISKEFTLKVNFERTGTLVRCRSQDGMGRRKFEL